jgi:predicted small secreted protein
MVRSGIARMTYTGFAEARRKACLFLWFMQAFWRKNEKEFWAQGNASKNNVERGYVCSVKALFRGRSLNASYRQGNRVACFIMENLYGCFAETSCETASGAGGDLRLNGRRADRIKNVCHFLKVFR